MADKEPVRAYKEWVSGLYARAAESYDQTGPRAFSHWGRRLVELAQIRAGETVVDVGTGRGQELFPAADRVGSRGRVVGIDFCQEMVRLTAAEISRRGLPNAGVCLMDAEELAFADAAFDCAVSSNVLFLCPQPWCVLSEMARVLRPGGCVAIIPSGGAGGFDPSWGSWWADLLEAYASESQALQEHRDELRSMSRALNRYWSESEQPLLNVNEEAGLEEALRRAGFADIQIGREEAEFLFADEEAWWTWQWSHRRRSDVERIEPAILARFKADVFERLQAVKGEDGIRVPGSTILAVATKP